MIHEKKEAGETTTTSLLSGFEITYLTSLYQIVSK